MLFTIADQVRARLHSRDRAQWESEIDTLLEHQSRHGGFRQALDRPGERFIFEIKRTSPSKNTPPLSLDVTATARCFQKCGAAAISVLTEGDFFGGSLTDLAEARRAVGLPLLRKEFVIDKLQIAEARAFGADAVLLIAALLPGEKLAEFVKYAASLQIDALVEIHDEAELEWAVDSGATTIGVNSRDLRTLAIDLSAGAQLLELVPDRCVRVAESGLRTRADVLMMRDAGADAFLIGTAVMRSHDIAATIRTLTGHD